MRGLQIGLSATCCPWCRCHFESICQPFAFDKDEIRERFVLEGAVFASAYVLANLLGNESGRIVMMVAR